MTLALYYNTDVDQYFIGLMDVRGGKIVSKLR